MNIEALARNSFKPPFSYSYGYIWDSSGNMLADDPYALRIRGWGRLGNLENGAGVQDAVGERIARILSEHWDSKPYMCTAKFCPGHDEPGWRCGTQFEAIEKEIDDGL